MIVDVLLWLPCKVLRHFLKPVIDMANTLGENIDVDEHVKEFDGI